MESRVCSAWLKPCFVLAALLLVGSVGRTCHLVDESAWCDEIVSLQNLDAPSLASFLTQVRQDDPPMVPLYFSILYGWTRLFGTSLIAARALSVILGLTLTAALFAAGNALFGRRAGLFAAIASALSLLHIYYSQEVRMYSLTLLLALLAVWAHLRTVERSDAKSITLSVILNTLLMCTHLFAFLIVGIQFVHLAALFLLRKTDRRFLATWLAPHIILAVLTAVWVSTIDFGALAKVSSYIWKPGFRDLIMAFLIFAGGRATNENPAEHLPTGFSLDLPLAALLYLLAAWGCWRALRGSEDRERNAVFALLLWIAAPALILFFMAHVWRPCFTYRYVVHGTLPLYLLAGFGWTRLRKRPVRFLTAAAVTVCLLHQASAVTEGPFRVNWKSISSYLESHAATTDDIILFQSISDYALRYNHPLKEHRVRVAEVWSELRDQAIESHRRGVPTWVVLVRWFDPEKFEEGLKREGIPFSYSEFASWPKARVYRIPAN